VDTKPLWSGKIAAPAEVIGILAPIVKT